MRNRSISVRACATRFLLTALILSLILPGVAAANEIVAEVENFGDALVFHPVVEYKQLILTVTGPCNYEYREVAKPGETPVFRVDPEVTIDGTYTYGLVVIPEVSGDVIEVLKNARKTGNNEEVDKLCRVGKLPGDPATQSHGFIIDRSEIIFDPNKTDAKVAGVPIDQDVLGDDLFESFAAAGLDIPLKDFVINDDLIVDGSACIGFDCVNGESFGFDTVRLKENNLRIKFDDTSVAASFPRNDWQLTANDSANGGASKFSIDDISGNRTPFTVEANARSHSLYVDDGGRIGNRTSTPSTEIHTIDGDTPTLRLQQDGSSGFAPQTWDVAGNETNFFIRDVTNGSTLPFRIRPGAPTSSIFIDVDGDVGLGTASPAADLHVVDGNASFLVSTGTNNGNVISLSSSTDDEDLWRLFETAAGGILMSMYDAGENEDFRLATTGGSQWMSGPLGLNCDDASDSFTIHDGTNAAGTDCLSGTYSTMNAGDMNFTVSSSRTLKENLSPVTANGILEKIDSVDVYTYDFIEGPKDRLGLMAEDFHQVFGRGSERMLSGQDVQMALWLAVKELSAHNQELSQRIEQLEAQKAQ